MPCGELTISHLDEQQNVSRFTSVSVDLNDFLKHDALIDQNNLIRKMHVQNHVVGFITLLADKIQVKSRCK